MSQITAEAVSLLEQLSDEGAKEILEHVRRLVEKEDDESWERAVESAVKKPKFAAYMEEVERDIREGRSEPFDESRL
jgi:hypothetical protein